MIDAIPPADLVEAIKRAPSLRGMILGYVAEEVFEKFLRDSHKEVTEIEKHDDHDRSKNKSDRTITYKGRKYTVQLKSLQTNSIRYFAEGKCLVAVAQNDGLLIFGHHQHRGRLFICVFCAERETWGPGDRVRVAGGADEMAGLDTAHFSLERLHAQPASVGRQFSDRATLEEASTASCSSKMISFSNIHEQYGKQLLFVDASFQLNPGEKVGLG